MKSLLELQQEKNRMLERLKELARQEQPSLAETLAISGGLKRVEESINSWGTQQATYRII